MELTKIDRQLPVKAYPEKELNHIILIQFTPWLAGLLSLTDEVSMDRLEIALPAIKEHCWSMGFLEIKKMFEMYADNKLSLKPIPNYFDRILFGKIVEAYKDQKPRKKLIPKENNLSEEEKEMIVFSGVINCFESYKQDGFIRNGYGYVYDLFYEKGKLPAHTKQFRDEIQNKAILAIEKEIKSKGITLQVKDEIKAFKQQKNGLNSKCKEIILSDYFDILIKTESDIKNEIK